MTRLGDVFPLIRNGASIKQTDGAEGLPITRIETIANREIDRSRMGYADVTDLVKYADYQLQDGDILMSHINSEKHLGKVARYKAIDGEYIIHGMNLLMLRADKSLITPGYAECFFNSDVFLRQIPNITKKSVNQASFNVSALKELQIPIPTLTTQHEIEMRFEKVDSLISLRKQQIAKLDELVKARFVEMFGDPVSNPKMWPVECAAAHIDLLSGYPFDSSQYTDDGINICGGLIIMPQRIAWDECKHWRSIEGFEEYALQENDIVMALDRPWISDGFKIAMIDAEHLPALLIQRTARIRATDINQQYLMYCFMNGGFDKHCNITGSLVPHISAKDIRSFPIMIPPLAFQQQFAAFVAQTDQQKLTIQHSLAQLELLKKALMQKYFG